MWKEEFQLRRHSSSINSIDISADMVSIATASSDRSIGLTNMRTKRTIFIEGHKDSVLCASFSPDAQKLATCSSNGSVCIWNATSGEKIGQYTAHQLCVRSLCWSPDGRYIATASNDKTASVWSVASNCFTKRHSISALNGWVRDVKWYSDLIALAGNDNIIPFYDYRSGKKTFEIQTGTNSDASSISFHHSGNCIAAGFFDRMVRVWDLRTTSLLQRHSAHTEPVTNVAFNPCTDDLLSVGRDCCARVWNLQTASAAACFRHHEAAVLSCCWLPSSKGFVTAGEDHKIMGYRMIPKAINPLLLDFDNGDMLDAINGVQSQLSTLAETMQALDRRLLLQEEKLQWLSDTNDPITKASQ